VSRSPDASAGESSFSLKTGGKLTVGFRPIGLVYCATSREDVVAHEAARVQNEDERHEGMYTPMHVAR
jgi:hypothetical protein